MRAYLLQRYGGPDAAALGDTDKPAVGPNDVLVRVHAAGLNPVDFKIREGKLRALFRPKLPAVLGSELSGEIVELGAKVSGFAVGDRVFARVAKEKMGAFAEFAAVDQSLIARMPRALPFDAAAGVPLAGLTALQALRNEMRLQPGQTVFIPGGAGGVGTFAIQIAKWLGARVITTASSKGDALVRQMGADEVIDYTRERFEDKVREVDGVFDLLGGDTLERSFAVVRRGGRVVSVAGVPEPQTAKLDLGGRPVLAVLFWIISRRVRALARKAGVSYRYLFMHPGGKELAELDAMIDGGQLRVVIDRVFPFERIGEAMAYLESGRAKGKVVVEMVSAA